MDFFADSLASGRRIKLLTVADDFTHECVEIGVDFGIPGQYVTRRLDPVAVFRGDPKLVRAADGPEFTSRTFMGWAQSRGKSDTCSSIPASRRRTPSSRASTASCATSA